MVKICDGCQMDFSSSEFNVYRTIVSKLNDLFVLYHKEASFYIVFYHNLYDMICEYII